MVVQTNESANRELLPLSTLLRRTLVDLSRYRDEAKGEERVEIERLIGEVEASVRRLGGRRSGVQGETFP